MKNFVRVICCVLVCAVLCGCAATNKGDSKDQLAKKFYTAFFLGDLDAISDCCPDSMEDYIVYGVRSADYGSVVKSVSIELTKPSKATASELEDIEDEYRDEVGISISIEEGYLYNAEATLHSKDGDTETRDVPFILVVAKIKGKWYAFPADL